MVTVHAQSEAHDASLARLAVNDGVIARRFCGGEFDFEERDAVRLDAAHPRTLSPRLNACDMCLATIVSELAEVLQGFLSQLLRNS